MELMAEARKVSARILVRGSGTNMKFVVSHLAENISLFHLDTVFARGSPIQKAHFPAGIIKKIGALHIHNLFDLFG